MSSTRHSSFFRAREERVYESSTSRTKPEVTISWGEGTREEKIPSSRKDLAEFEPLLPPFMQTKSRKHFPGEERLSEISNKVTDIDATRQTRLPSKTNIISPGDKTADFTSACGNTESAFFDGKTFNLGGEVVEKSDISCQEDCEGINVKCEELWGRIYTQTKSFAEIAEGEPYDSFELRDSDYQEWEEEFDRDEADRHRVGSKKRFSRSSDRCESLLSTSDEDEEEDLSDTTDPYVSHELLLPYNRIPRARIFDAAGKDVEYVAASLPRRPRSPIREILPEKFDLKTAYKEWKNRQGVVETRKYLRESKDRISQSLKQLSEDQADKDTLISSVVLETVCEQVTLTMTDMKIDIDIRTFVNIATIWALVDLDLFNRDSLNDEQFRILKELGIIDSKQKIGIETCGSTGMRRTLLAAYRPNFGRNICPSMHHRLPWFYVSPAHERGHTKFYPNVRERIDEKIPKMKEQVTSAYVPDLTCFHLREVLEKAYVAYRRRSKSIFLPRKPDYKDSEGFFVHLVSFM